MSHELGVAIFASNHHLDIQATAHYSLLTSHSKKKKRLVSHFSSAEKEGFEPPVHCCTTVFKTAAFDRSAISPLQRYKFFIPRKSFSKKIFFLFHTPNKSSIFVIRYEVILQKYYFFITDNHYIEFNFL